MGEAEPADAAHHDSHDTDERPPPAWIDAAGDERAAEPDGDAGGDRCQEPEFQAREPGVDAGEAVAVLLERRLFAQFLECDAGGLAGSRGGEISVCGPDVDAEVLESVPVDVALDGQLEVGPLQRLVAVPCDGGVGVAGDLAGEFLEPEGGSGWRLAPDDEHRDGDEAGGEQGGPRVAL